MLVRLVLDAKTARAVRQGFEWHQYTLKLDCWCDSANAANVALSLGYSTMCEIKAAKMCSRMRIVKLLYQRRAGLRVGGAAALFI